MWGMWRRRCGGVSEEIVVEGGGVEGGNFSFLSRGVGVWSRLLCIPKRMGIKFHNSGPLLVFYSQIHPSPHPLYSFLLFTVSL